MAKKSRGGYREGAGRKKADPALLALRNPTAARRAERAKAQAQAMDDEAMLLARLADAGLPPEATAEDWQRYHYGMSTARLELAWRERREAILAVFTAQYPGTRPSCWWDFDAPRQPLGTWPGYFIDGKLPAPRERLGGKGTPAFEVLNYMPEYAYGLPTRWVDDWSIALYTGQARDVHGKRMFAEYAGKDFTAQHFDRTDPPRFESQATYLRRHALLSRQEKKLLTADYFEPEALPECYWPEESR